MNPAALHLPTIEGRCEGLHEMEDLYRKEAGARELLMKEDKGLFLGPDIFPLREE